MIIKLASLEGLPKAGLHTQEVHGSSPCVSTKHWKKLTVFKIVSFFLYNN